MPIAITSVVPSMVAVSLAIEAILSTMGNVAVAVMLVLLFMMCLSVLVVRKRWSIAVRTGVSRVVESPVQIQRDARCTNLVSTCFGPPLGWDFPLAQK